MHPRRLLIALALLLPLLAGCAGGEPAASPGNEYGGQPADTSSGGAAAPAAPADGVDRDRLSDELYFYNWSDYIDPAILEQFEAEYGVRVIYDTYDSNEDMIAKVRAGNSGYDIVVPSDYAVQIVAVEELAQPLDKALLPNLAGMDPGYLGVYFDEANTISVPYMVGLTGIAYNSESFPDGVDSWATIFDPEQASQHTGKFSMLDDERETPGAALKYLGTSLNDTDPAAMQRAQELLIAQKPYLAAYNSSDVNRKLASGEYVIAHAWSGTAMQARNGLGDEFAGNPAINFVIPEEGGTIWMDNLVILRDSPNAYTAHVFINYLMRPEVAAQNAEYIGYITPVADAVPLLSEEVRELYAAGFAPDEAMLERLEWIERNEATAAFTDLWTVVKGE
ncbi:MAG TPA: spermidine/putrescine ABC transporter substrate-binding protein [Chloroflexaceae bacterium]|nr:spermidine/putrescine ABC transporter substrate-binding protein [Chloroflexaceae bacterium]